MFHAAASSAVIIAGNDELELFADGGPDLNNIEVERATTL
jgi:hypothetical protein